MKEYTYFISQFTCICYVVTYSSFFFVRRRKGIITSQMLQCAARHWYIFASIGLLEALNFLTSLHAAARLPGGLIGVLGQTGLLWSVALSHSLLGKRFDLRQLLGVFIVAAGVTICSLPQAAAAGLTIEASRELTGNMLLYLVSTGCGALTSILKEWAFSREDLDIFVVNTLGSAAQCVFTLLLLPITLALATTLPPAEYMARGWAAFCGATHPAMPWLAIAYILANLTVNISAITLVKRGGAVRTTLAGPHAHAHAHARHGRGAALPVSPPNPSTPRNVRACMR
jgi:drug/metabolite transporter (DMT)-like permease